MIYTRFGVKVKIIKYNEKKEQVTIQDINDSKWVSKRHIGELRADRGIEEIEENLSQFREIIK